MTATDTAADPTGGSPARLSLPRTLVPPVAVAVAVGLTVWWLAGRELGTLEARTLTASALWRLTLEHLRISLIATVVVLATAIPIGVLLTRRSWRRLLPAVGAAATIGQAATAFGMMVLFRLVIGVSGPVAAVAGMVVYSFLPVLRGTITGVDQVDGNIVKSARAMGMSRRQILWRVELPLSVPVVLSGVRIALVLTVATTTIAALVQAGGLGLLIVRGFAAGRDSLIVVGFVATAGLAILADWVGQIVEDLLRPRGL